MMDTKSTNNNNAIDSDMLKLKDMNEKIDYNLLRTIIGTKRKHHHGSGVVPIMSEELANEMHKPIRRNFENFLQNIMWDQPQTLKVF